MPAQAQCPSCGYETLTLIAEVMTCGRAECGYEHLITHTLPIIIQTPRNNPD